MSNPISPWLWSEQDYLNKNISISIEFDNESLDIKEPGLTSKRDPGFIYSKAIFGPTDGTGIIIELPDQDFSISPEKLNELGFYKISDILDKQFTLSK